MSTQPVARTIRATYLGTWCDNCRTAFSYNPASGLCPDCRTVRMRKATITVDVHDEPGLDRPVSTYTPSDDEQFEGRYDRAAIAEADERNANR